MTALPARLYKYERPTMQALRNLKKAVLIFGSPSKFNDPYDCALVPRIIPPTDPELEEIRKHYLTSKTIPDAIRHQHRTANYDTLRTTLSESCMGVLQETAEKKKNTQRETSFSETNETC